jgi:hypothetical protein
MTTLAEVRQKYPQYGDLSDEQLAKSLHQKFYSDISYDDFSSRIGLSKPKAEPEINRTGAAVGGVNKGLAGLAGLPVDTVENIVNLGIAAYGAAKQGITGKPGPDLIKGSFGGSESISTGQESIGLNTLNPSPQDAASRMLYTGGMVAGGSVVPGAGVRSTAAAAGSGALAGEVLGPEWVGPAVMGPAAAGQGVQAAREAVARRVRPNVETFEEAGVTPTVGQATESNFLQGLETLLSKFPGGQGIFRRFSENQQVKLGDNTKTGVSAEDAGRAIEKGITGFVGRTKETWKRLDDAVAAKVGNATAPITNTAAALDDLTKPIAGVDAFVNPKIAAIKDSLSANPSFQELRALRSRIGAMLDDALVSGIPGGELKKVYGALSKDLEASATQAGAGKEFARQSEYYSARMDRIEGTLERVLGKTPEETFRRFMPTDSNQVTTVRQVMRSLDPEQRKIVQDAVVNRLGRAKSSKQDDVGEVFSSETFLTNWDKLSPGAKNQIFSDPAVRKNMDAVASVASNVREGSNVFINPSGSAGAGAAYATAGTAAIGSVAAGSVAPAVAAAGLVTGANIGSRMLTSPRVVEWLSQAPKVPAGREAAHLARLGVIYNETKDPALKQELGDYITSIK